MVVLFRGVCYYQKISENKREMSVMIYIIIFLAKLCEVAIATVRIVLTTRGNRVMATLLSAVEITIWVIIASTVLLGMGDDPLQAVAYCLAFVVGINLGIMIEDKLALGLTQIEVIAGPCAAEQIIANLRENGYGVTVFECAGLMGKKLSLNVKVLRKDVAMTIKLLKAYEDLMITITDIREVSVGRIEKRILKGK